MNYQVSRAELMNYFKRNNITDYTKTKNNYPDMRCHQNKMYRSKLLKEKLLEQNKIQNMNSYTSEAEPNYRSEILNLSEEDIKMFKSVQEACVICGESMKTNHLTLKCNHAFCSDCAISHFRVNNKCPLCRTEICESPKKITPMSSQLCDGIIDHEMSVVNNYPVDNCLFIQDTSDSRFTTTLMTLLYYYEVSCDQSLSPDEAAREAMKDSLKQSMLKLIKKMTFTACGKICGYYDNQS